MEGADVERRGVKRKRGDEGEGETEIKNVLYRESASHTGRF